MIPAIRLPRNLAMYQPPIAIDAKRIGASDSTLEVAVSSAFPAGPGVLLIDKELIKFAANDGQGTFAGLPEGGAS